MRAALAAVALFALAAGATSAAAKPIARDAPIAALRHTATAGLIVAAAPTGAATPAPQFALDPHAGTWVHGPNLPSPRQDAASAVLDGRIYVVGGFGPDSQSTDSNFVLEPAVGTNLAPQPEQTPQTVPLGTWSSARPIPEAVDHAAAAAAGGFLYVAGGSIEKMVTNKFWRYDPIEDSWTMLPPMPIARYGATMQALGGKLYLLGGATAHGHDDRSIEVYDPATAAWRLIDNALSVEREASATAVFENRIALVGGRDREERNFAACDLYDPANDRWSTCSAMHAGRSGFGLAAVADRLFAIGGVSLLSGLATQTTEISGPGAHGWMEGHWLPAPRQGMCIAVLGRIVYVIGGSNWDATAPTASVLRYIIPLVRVRFGGRAPQ